jgi:two-component system nitrogen regulation sensor histidine kinase NtrY
MDTRAATGDGPAMSEADISRPPSELLAVILDGQPGAVVLLAETGTIVFTNAAARALFFGGHEVTGQNFLHMLAGAAEPLRAPLLSDSDQIFTFDDGGETETYHVAKRPVVVDGRAHTLVTVRHMTDELARQEIAALKKALRIIGHELANSMAPAKSLLRSAQQMLGRPEQEPSVRIALQIVEERLAHLHGFLGGLAALGQLPRPRKREVAWTEVADGLRALWPDVAVAVTTETPGWFDAAQITQVLINLVKNAHEADGPRDAVAITIETATEGGHRVTVLDRGPGMSDELMRSALVPAFTTKDRGSGMGLPLCREIVAAHDGRLRIARRDGGGTAVSFWLPPRRIVPAASRARLTLTAS